jgi:hypothetical protein
LRLLYGNAWTKAAYSRVNVVEIHSICFLCCIETQGNPYFGLPEAGSNQRNGSIEWISKGIRHHSNYGILFPVKNQYLSYRVRRPAELFMPQGLTDHRNVAVAGLVVFLSNGTAYL